MAHPRRFRFGVDLQQPFDGRSWLDTVREVEGLGYSTLFVPDHFDEGLGPITALATAAAVTTHAQRRDARARLRLPPSGGAGPRAGEHRRAVGGPARGRVSAPAGSALDYERSGIPMDRPKVRVDRMIEHTPGAARACSPTGRSASPATHYTITDLDGTPEAAPPGRPAVPHRRRRAAGAALRRLGRRHRRRERVDPLR